MMLEKMETMHKNSRIEKNNNKKVDKTLDNCS